MAKRVNYRDQVVDGELDLSMSDLQEVPVRDIALAKKAITLDLSNNRLLSIGKNFPTLTHLVKLNLSKNQIGSLPSNFGDLVLLKHLDLYSNKLIHLPLSFGKLKNLRWLDLKQNPLVPALQEIAGPCQDPKQCQACAIKVVQVLADSLQRFEAEQERQLQEQRLKEMAEKAAAKKDQQKSKKATKNEKKNGLNKQEPVQRPPQKKKEKSSKQVSKVPPKKTGSFCGRLIRFVFTFTFIVTGAAAALYWYDNEKFVQVEGQLRTSLNQTSTFLNTDPRVKEHWSNLKNIAAISYERAGQFASSVATNLPIYFNDAKRFIFEKKAET